MKRAEPAADGPSGSENSLLPRDGPEQAEEVPTANKGGRGIKSKACWEQGAAKGSVMCFFSRKNKKGELLEEGKYRCILHEHETQEVILTKGDKGEWNLKQHVKTVHGFVPSDSAPAASSSAPSAAKKTKNRATNTMAKYLVPQTRAPTKDELSVLVYRYIVTKSRPFLLVSDDAFKQMLYDALFISGVAVSMPFELVERQTIKNWIQRDAKICRDFLRNLWKKHFTERYWSFSMDERKADNKKVPLVNVILHGALLGEKTVEYVSIPLAIVELKEGKSHAGLRSTLVQVFESYSLPMRFCLSGTGDEADRDVIGKLMRFATTPVVYIPDPAHLTSTSVKRAASATGLMATLFEPTKEAVQAIRSKYALRQAYNEARKMEENLVDGKPVLELVDWSKTRIIGSLHGGYRFHQNIEVIKEVARRSANARAAVATQASSLAKFPASLSQSRLDEMASQWAEISRFGPVLNDMVVAFSAERYPRVSDLVCASFMMKLHIQYFLTGAGARASPLSPSVKSFAEQLKSELDEKFLPNLKNLVICAAVACDVRYRDFDPATIDSDACPELFLLSKQYDHLHQSYGETICVNATKCFYELFPEEWQAELQKNSALIRSYNPVNQERRGVNGLEQYWSDTKFYKELKGFCAKERHMLEDPTRGTSVNPTPMISFKTHPLHWMHLSGAQTPRLRRLAYAVFGASSNQIGCERLWKSLSLNMSKHRGALEVESGVDQTFLKQIWAISSVYTCLEPLKPVQVEPRSEKK